MYSFSLLMSTSRKLLRKVLFLFNVSRRKSLHQPSWCDGLFLIVNFAGTADIVSLDADVKKDFAEQTCARKFDNITNKVLPIRNIIQIYIP